MSGVGLCRFETCNSQLGHVFRYKRRDRSESTWLCSKHRKLVQSILEGKSKGEIIAVTPEQWLYLAVWTLEVSPIERE